MNAKQHEREAHIVAQAGRAGAVTIAKTLGKSEKTIRLHRDQAYSALEAMLKADKML